MSTAMTAAPFTASQKTAQSRIRAVTCAGLVFALALGLANAGWAQTTGVNPDTNTVKKGPVTGLNLPRYVSLKFEGVNVRRGPARKYKVDWVFKHPAMPLRITAEYSNWRRVQDRDGYGGWVHYSQLSGVRTVIVEQDALVITRKSDPRSAPVAQLELGVIARLGACTPSHCEIRKEGYKGWAAKSALWGVADAELRD